MKLQTTKLFITSQLSLSFIHRANWHSSATLTGVFPCFFSAVRQMPRYNSQRRGTTRTLPKLIVSLCVLFVCKCVLYCCHREATQMQFTNISYHISYYVISYHTTFLPPSLLSPIDIPTNTSISTDGISA